MPAPKWRCCARLAAQQTVGNLIAGTVLLSARPFRVGDRMRVDLRARVESHVRPSEVERLLGEAVTVETRSEPDIELEKVDAGELIYRVRATPAESAAGAELADEVVTALVQVSNKGHDGYPLGMEATTRVERTDDDRSVGDLVNQLSQQTTTLLRQELLLAQTELQEKGKRLGKGAGMFGGAGLVALYGVGALVAAAIIGIGTFLEQWLAAVIVGVVLLVVAGILALLGRKQVERGTPPVPRLAIESAKRDVDEVKAARTRA